MGYFLPQYWYDRLSEGIPRARARHNTDDDGTDDDAGDHGNDAAMRVVHHRRDFGTATRVDDDDDDDDARGRPGGCVNRVWVREGSRRRTRGSDGKRARAAVRDDDGNVDVDEDAVSG